MKKILPLITAIILLCVLSLPASAQSIYEYLHGVAWTNIEPLPSSKNISIPGTIIITKSTTITDKNIIIETNGILEIKNGASLTLQNTRIFIENGGTIKITDGTLKVKGRSVLDNNGTIVVEEAGKINITYGFFNVLPEAKFINNGKFTGYKGKNLTSTLSQIKSFDSAFDLSDYVISLRVIPDSATDIYPSRTTIDLFYRIDNIRTDYRYILTLTKNKLNFTHPDQPPSEIYTPELIDSLRARVEQYTAPAENYACIQRQSYFLYYYNATKYNEPGTLIAETLSYFTDGEIIADNVTQEYI
ncbi:MAG: hypothetical protein ACI4WS_07400 [Oscillospiraceae bacterium]